MDECKPLLGGEGEMQQPRPSLRGRGLHSFTLEHNLSNFRTRSCVKLGYTVDGRAQVELKSERV